MLGGPPVGMNSDHVLFVRSNDHTSLKNPLPAAWPDHVSMRCPTGSYTLTGVRRAAGAEPRHPRDALAAALRNLVIGEPVTEELVAVYPLYARTTLPDEPWGTLDAALRDGTFEIRDGKQTRRVEARNAGDRPVLLFAGELLAGGHQDRIVVHDTRVPPGRAWADVAVYCAEPGRSVGRTDRFDAAPVLAPPDLRGLLAVDAGQPAVWAGIRRRLDALGVRSPTGSLRALYASGPVPARVRALAQRLGDLPTRDVRTVGVAYGSDRGLIAAECFASNTLLCQAWPRVLAAAAAHAAVRLSLIHI